MNNPNDIIDAYEELKRLVTTLGAAARRTIEERFSPAVIGARYRRRLEAVATF